MFIRTLLLAAAVSAIGAAQTEVQVLPSQLAVAFGGISGKVVLYTDAAIFVDDSQPAASFALLRANIKSLDAAENNVTVMTLKPVRDREGERSRLAFRLADAAAAATFQKWHAADTSPSASKDAPPQSQIEMQYDARHKKRFYGSNRGRLIVTAEKIIYESIDDISRSRQWRYNEIKQLKRDNPYSIRIEPFTGDDYEFELLGKPLDNADFQKLIGRITSARAIR
jgi:hypothetical protein